MFFWFSGFEHIYVSINIKISHRLNLDRLKKCEINLGKKKLILGFPSYLFIYLNIPVVNSWLFIFSERFKNDLFYLFFT